MVLDPDEERRARVRRQEQSVRSARTLLVNLPCGSEQVKEIEEDLEKLSPHKVKHTRKSRAMARLAAAHRGAARALQSFMTHLANNHPQPPPPSSATHVRQLGHLLRQLSLCSARLKMDCSVPEVIVDLLLQIEDLDSLLAQQASLALPPGDLPKNSSQRLPPQREKVAVAVAASQPKKPAAARKLLPDEPTKPEEISHPPETNRAGGSPRALGGLPPSQAEALGQREAGEASGPGKAAVGPGRDCRPSRRKAGVLFSTRPQGSSQAPRAKRPQPLGKQAHFQEATVSFRLKETKPPARESKPPWLPPSLSSPLSSPPRNPGRSSQNKEPSPERGAAPGGKQGTPRKEAARAGSAGGSPTQVARQIEQAVREHLEPLLARAQAAAAASVASVGGVPDGGLGASAMERATRTEAEPLLSSGGPDLEAMLRRMEEMEHFQEAVRRRYHQVVYSDTFLEDAREEMRGRTLGAALGGPEASGAPPPPIQITRVGSPRKAQADIVLGRPLDAEAVEEEEEKVGSPEPRRQEGEQPPARHHPPRRTGGLSLSIPLSVLQSIRDYGSRYEQHLRGMAHEPVGSFDPWRVTQSLAEKLVEEALAEVAAELQGLCEDYAEAVFTSEFLQAPE
ncbi:hypothetical protein JRQ81_008226 [Phrynocephalus forsythii]|uniref:Protein moonraker n=1 Tax=Phrynocephalus forsythii TaxID=171643 RepID=A0A9Q0XEV5_9SAUR|nr:hypothetical protein JRQ81_008226 [Phrynocephalus forsythii]